MKHFSITGSLHPWAAFRILLLFLVSWSVPANAQTADSLSQVKNIYIGTSDSGPHAEETRKLLTDALQKDHSVTIVTDPATSDAILNATSEIWVNLMYRLIQEHRATAIRFTPASSQPNSTAKTAMPSGLISSHPAPPPFQTSAETSPTSSPPNSWPRCTMPLSRHPTVPPKAPLTS